MKADDQRSHFVMSPEYFSSFSISFLLETFLGPQPWALLQPPELQLLGFSSQIRPDHCLDAAAIETPGGGLGGAVSPHHPRQHMADAS